MVLSKGRRSVKSIGSRHRSDASGDIDRASATNWSAVRCMVTSCWERMQLTSAR